MTDGIEMEEQRLDFLKTQSGLRIDQMIADNVGLNYKDTHTQTIPAIAGKIDITKRKRN